MNHCYCVLVALVVFSFLLASVKPDLAADKAGLLALRSAVGGRTRLWNATESSPCSWVGVECKNNRISKLRLPCMGLAGEIPENTIGNLTKLVTLSLRFNALSGSLPSDFSSLSNLRNLYLQSNKFSGPIPTFIFSLKNIVRLSLASNNFSGPISSDFSKLNRLGSLFLEKNRLSGEIPNLDLPVLVGFNVSHNLLIGSIPEKLSSKEESAFVGNDLCGRPLKSCGGRVKKSKIRISVGVIIGGLLLGCLVGVLVILVFIRLNRGCIINETRVFRPRTESEVDKRAIEESIKYQGKLVHLKESAIDFDFEDLYLGASQLLGKGTFGTVFTSTMASGLVVAIKTLKEVVVAQKVYKDMIEAVGNMDHENLLPLWAYVLGAEQNLLVYDYMPMGSLSAILHENGGADRSTLNWVRRTTIALGAARGIAYIHSQGKKVSHGNIKSSNILLTESYEARVTDIAIAELFSPNTSPNRGYRAPEVTDSRRVSQEADVYSFGVLLLELLTGLPPTLNANGVDLPGWVQSVVKEEWTAEVFDVELLKDKPSEEDIIQLLQLALACSDQYPDRRPSMIEVSKNIEKICVSG